MNTREIWDAFTGIQCAGCGGVKRKFSGFCVPCYRQLPKALQNTLWQKFGSGFETGLSGVLVVVSHASVARGTQGRAAKSFLKGEMPRMSKIATVSQRDGNGDWHKVPLEFALSKAASGEWYECHAHKNYDDGMRTFHPESFDVTDEQLFQEASGYAEMEFEEEAKRA